MDIQLHYVFEHINLIYLDESVVTDIDFHDLIPYRVRECLEYSYTQQTVLLGREV